MQLRAARLICCIGLILGLLLAYSLPSARGQEHPASSSAPSPALTAPHPEPSAHPAAAPTAFHEEDSHSGADHTSAFNGLLVALLIILIGAKLGGELMERLGQPAVLGEILTGIVLGNLSLVGFHGLDYLHTNAPLLALSELGVLLLLFEVGLESNIHEMRRVGLSSLLVATLGVIAPFALGWGVARFFLPSAGWQVHVFIGATLCATSVGITARVLKDLGQLQRPESRIVLGAAVIDDVMGLVILAVVGGLITASTGGTTLGLEGVLLIVVKALGFLVGALVIGSYLSPRLFRLASYLTVRHMLLVTSLGFCFLLARLAAEIGLAPIVGAFAAGLILDPVHYRDFTDQGEHTIEELIHPISGFLVPIFFVVTGMKVDLRALGDVGVLGFAAALTTVAVLGKQVCALGVLERGLNRIAVGVGMVPRGEVGLIFANIGLSLRILGHDGRLVPVVTPSTFSAVVIMVMVTTLITPPLLKSFFTRSTAESPTP